MLQSESQNEDDGVQGGAHRRGRYNLHQAQGAGSQPARHVCPGCQLTYSAGHLRYPNILIN